MRTPAKKNNHNAGEKNLKNHDLDKLTKDELINRIKQLEKQKKYGLVWEYKPEDVVTQCQTQLPVLEEITDKEIHMDPEGPTNILIEGDNYHALSVLNYTHAGKIDVIYIDPPYNTGARTWKYNNNYVDKDDNYKHSKFISFMSNRFEIAINLLKPSGIIICAIDDYEIHNVRHLLDSIVGENNRLGTIVVVHNPRGRNDDKFFATMHEYMLIYAKDSSKAIITHFALTQEEKEKYNKQDEISFYNETSYIRTGNNSKRIERPNLYYPIYYDPDNDYLDLTSTGKMIELLPLDKQGEEKTWRWEKKTFLEKKETELLTRKVNGVYRIFKKRRITNIAGTKPKTIWNDPKYDASSHGIMLLKNIFNGVNPFPYPKSLYTLKDILSITTQKEAIILDYFAGSGTTGHATLELNKEDNGRRKFILCTDNENKIAEDVCYPRINKIIKGYFNTRKKHITGIPGNMKYFKTSFVYTTSVSDDTRQELVRKSTEMICLREDTFTKVTDNQNYKIYKNKQHQTGILFNLDVLDEFKKNVEELNEPASIYVFSLSDDTFDEDFQDLKIEHKLCAIPESILEVYRRLFKEE